MNLKRFMFVFFVLIELPFIVKTFGADITSKRLLPQVDSILVSHTIPGVNKCSAAEPTLMLSYSP